MLVTAEKTGMANAGQRKDLTMRALQFIERLLRGLWRSGQSMPTGIDSHKWESKLEILRLLSTGCH
jgi:hypothetical protein